MGVKFAREFEEIIAELVQALGPMDGCAELLEFDTSQWAELDEAEKTECLRTLADDIFYGLGSEPSMSIGEGIITYEADKHTILLKYADEKVIRVIHLI